MTPPPSHKGEKLPPEPLPAAEVDDEWGDPWDDPTMSPWEDEETERSLPKPPSHKDEKLPPEPLTAAEVDRLIAAASNRSSSGIRLRAIIGVLYGSGLRIAETLNLYPRDVDTQTNTIRVRHGKGDKSRTVGINPQGSALLDRWLDRRHALGLTARHPVFAAYTIGKLGQPLDQRYVRAALAKLAEKAGETKRVHPHGLRHSLAFDLAQQGVPTHQIQQQLGHESLAITDRYVRHLMPGDVIDMMKHHTWGGAPKPVVS